MKTLKRSFLIAAAAMLSNHCFAQWIQLNSGTSNWLYDIDCPTENICYAVGASGTILKTTDGGATWVLKNSGVNTSESYFAVNCINKDTCFTAHGNNGIYKTIDGGDTWIAKNMPGGFGGISKIFMVNDSIGYTSGSGGGRYLKTTDGGENWIWEDVFIHNGGNGAPFFIDENIGFFAFGIIANNGVIKTVNGGNTWTFSLTDAPCGMTDIFLPTDSFGIAVSINGCAYRTTDQGATWDTLNTGTNESLYSIFCIDEDTCYVTGTAGTVIKTINGGNTWIFDTVGVPTYIFYAVSFPTPLVGYAVGTAGKIIKTDKSTGFNGFTYINPQTLISPNPFSYKTTIYCLADKTNNKNLDFELYDLLGNKILIQSISSGSNTLQRKGLPAGIYIYSITDKTRILNTGKIIIN